MDRSHLKSICDQVYRKYPEVKNSSPRVQTRSDGQFLVIFRGSGKAADGRTMATIVRAVVSTGGKIVKLTSSRS